MAKKAKKLHTKKGVELKIVNPNAAGIDIAVNLCLENNGGVMNVKLVNLSK